MSKKSTDFAPTRMLFMGDPALTDGFQLIGFETWSDPTVSEFDQILAQLVNDKQNALVIIDSRLSESGSLLLNHVRAEGGRIVITEVPPLNDPEGFYCNIDDQVKALLGGDCMEKKENSHESGV